MLVLAVIGTTFLIGFRSVAVEAVYPVERARQSFVRQVWSRVSGVFNAAAAGGENVRLRREVASLAMARQDLERLEVENARLRRALEYKSRLPETWVAAGVLSSDGGAAGAHDTVRVDKGSLDKVRMGAVVVTPDGLVGRVTLVTPHTSEITLITDGSMKVACEVETDGRTRPAGILCGGNADLLALMHLTETAEVPPRSRVLTSGLGGIFPKGLVIGTLLDVRKDVGNLSCSGEVLPAVDYSALEDVFIRCEK